ncbi:MAG TPA: SIMPL domain-containing protein [Candidatus Paceibacterota bacterium]|nr:SIMPL domain-containing protein [Candidatus Paceibacterota bacterium]
MNEFIEKKENLIKVFSFVGLLLALFLLVTVVDKIKEYRFIGSGLTATNTITVTGTGKVEKAPDTARISFTIQNESKDVATAQDAVSKKVDAITAALKALGIADADIKTDSYSSYPQYDYPQTPCYGTVCPRPGTPTLRGYQVSHAITVSVKDLTKVDVVLGALGQNGVTDMSGPNFGFEDDKEVAREARDMAIVDAKAEAQKLAKSLGVRLVRIVSFSENNGGYPTPMYAGADMMATKAATSTPSVPVGTQKVESDVTIVYEIR